MLPKYERIKQELLADLKQHDFIPGDKFYSEADIKRLFGVSSITAVKVLNELTSAGYLYRVQGKGTYISKSKVSQAVKFSDIELYSQDRVSVKVLSVTEESDPAILKELKLEKGDSYYKFIRIRFFDTIPYIVQITHMIKSLVKTPISSDLSTYSSLYKRVRDDFCIDLTSMASIETNEIDFPDNPEILKLLNLSFREPAVKQIKTTYLPDKSVAEYITTYKHWKFYKIKIETEAE
ncbi:MAG: GntR family transcriptional regulator [Streptococcaceae bacterium]|nr:GntR family transcriptional regulator [Streptococcaceae bacterium]